MTTTQSQYEFLQSSVSESDSLMVTLFFAAVLHIFLLLGISFALPKANKINKQIEITLSSSPAKKAPKNAKFLAQDNQVGAGYVTEKPTPSKQKLAGQGQSENKPPRKKSTQIESKPLAKQKLITRKVAKQKISTTIKKTPPSEKKQRHFTEESLKRDIAELVAEQNQLKKQSSEKTRIKFASSLAAHKYAASQYVKDFEDKIERIAKLNLPQRTIKGFGSLRMDVAINPNGTLYNLKIRTSSGSKEADDAAIRIVKLGEPYPALPKELLNETDVLAISRSWGLKDE